MAWSVKAARERPGIEKSTAFSWNPLEHSGSDATYKKYCNLHRLATEILLFTQRQRRNIQKVL